jgi:hypothetical protein
MKQTSALWSSFKTLLCNPCKIVGKSGVNHKIQGKQIIMHF